MSTSKAAWLLAVALLAGCGGELPPDKAAYAGLWKNNETSLLITENGRLEYESNAGTVQTSLSAPIKAFTDTSIAAGFLFLASDFRIDRPPEEVNGVWSMVIDGQELYRTDELGQLPQAASVPSLDVLRTLVTADLQRLDQGIAANDFSAFLDHASLAFQSQFDNARMQEIYQAFVEQQVDLEPFMQGDFVLVEEPAISSDGILTVAGRYPTEPPALWFESSYVYAHPEWKAIGIDVSIGGD